MAIITYAAGESSTPSATHGLAMPRFPSLVLPAAFLFLLLAALVVQISGPPITNYSGLDTGEPTRILLLTAHPDDECMFFAPTLLGLAKSVHRVSGPDRLLEIFSLCLSVGNADGLGTIRRDELGRSLDVLGVPSSRRWVEDRR